MTRLLRTGLAVAGLAIAAGTIATPALAEGAYNATVAGQANFTPLVNLASSSTQQVAIVNLPANVGVYALHCKVPADPRSAPTLCDSSAGSLAYLEATAADRASVTTPLRINGEFYGTNPNPTAGASTGESVDCRAATGNPRATACAVYVLGAGRESANPAYLRVFPTSFLPVSAQRRTDRAVIALDGATVARGARPKLAVDAVTPFVVTLASGLKPSVTSDTCAVGDGTITALKDTGTCVVRITSTGGRNVKPLVTTQVFRLTR